MKVDIVKCLLCIDRFQALVEQVRSLNKREMETLMLGLEQAILDDKIKKYQESEDKQ